MYKNKKIAHSTYVRTLCSEKHSIIMIWFYNTSLSFSFAPYQGTDNRGIDKYDKSKAIKTSINYEGAALLYQAAMSICKDENPQKQLRVELPCFNHATLILECKPEQYTPGQHQSNQHIFNPHNSGQHMHMQNNHVAQVNYTAAYLTIAQNNEAVSFKFPIHIVEFIENNQVSAKIIQSGLGVFALTLHGYLTGIGADNHLNKLPESHDV